MRPIAFADEVFAMVFFFTSRTVLDTKKKTKITDNLKTQLFFLVKKHVGFV